MFDFIKNLLSGNAQSKADANLQRELDKATQIDYQRGATLGNKTSGTTYNPNLDQEIMNDYSNLQSFQDAGNYDNVGISNEAQNTIFDVEKLLSSFVNPVTQALQQWNDRLSEFDKNNPFSFDEAQAKASAAERLNPYYDTSLNEFMTGIRNSRNRSTEDMTRTVGELNADATKLSERERFSTQEAIRQSEEGMAGAGLFFSGKRMRDTGVQEVQGIQNQQDITTNLERGIGSAQRSNLRTAEDLALQEARTKRLTEAERTTALETDIANQKKEAQIKRELEKQAYAGPAPGGSFQNQLGYQNQMYGMY